MSMNSARVVCTGCDYQTREMYRPIRVQYQTAEGNITETSCTKGWCYSCDGYSDIEHLNSAEFQQQHVAQEHERDEILVQLEQLSCGLFWRWRHRSARRQLKYELETLDKSIGTLRQLLEMLANRRAKARCLKCWSDKTVPISFKADNGLAEGFQHQCGGYLRLIQDWQGPRFNFGVTTYTLNPEGELISTEN